MWIRNSLIIIRGKVIDGTKLDGFIALKNNKIVGLITYMIEANECEICSLNSFIENKGIGTALINKVKEYADNELPIRDEIELEMTIM